jgi:hypothetical protein
MISEGREFVNAKPEIVINYLRNLKVRQLDVSPSNLQITCDGRNFKLKVLGKNNHECPVRRSFIYKLLRWYSFPVRQVERLSGETLASICNDYLLNIKRDYVTVKFEDDFAVTVTSPGYNEITDLEVIKRVSSWGIGTISRNDYLMRITTVHKDKFQPVRGDDCGAGLSVINSETGFHALTVGFFIFRYICSNGAIAKIREKNENKVHYGNKPDELSVFLNDRMHEATKRRGKVISRLKIISERPASESEDMIRKVRSQLGRKHLQETDGMTQYDLFNYITSHAKNYPLSKRIYLESLAGELVF